MALSAHCVENFGTATPPRPARPRRP